MATVTVTTTDRAAAQPWAATRDASWYPRPNTRSPKRAHVSGRTVREGVMSRCGRSLLDDGTSWPLADVPATARCQSRGCREAWPTTTTTTEA